MRRSAALLKSPVIDLMQIHNLVDWRTQLATLRRMKEAGRSAISASPITRPAHLPSWRTSWRASPASILSNAPIRWRARAENRSCRSRPSAGSRSSLTGRSGKATLFRRVRGRTLPGLGRRIRLHELGAVAAQIHPRRAGGDLRDPGHRQPRPLVRQFQGRLRPPARRGAAPPSARLLGRVVRRYPLPNPPTSVERLGDAGV